MFNPDQALKIVADDWPSLRRSDVFRLLDTYEGHRDELAETIIEHRPELRAEVSSVLFELGEVVAWPGQNDF